MAAASSSASGGYMLTVIIIIRPIAKISNRSLFSDGIYSTQSHQASGYDGRIVIRTPPIAMSINFVRFRRFAGTLPI
ncbi:MAG: hypothetical protein M3232_03790 [Thermoproteota archaeon]|nr:hypothetical protein [Thermoproteota archaeon]